MKMMFLNEWLNNAGVLINTVRNTRLRRDWWLKPEPYTARPHNSRHSDTLHWCDDTALWLLPPSSDADGDVDDGKVGDEMILGHPTTDREDAGVVVSACGCTRPVYVWLVTDDLIAAGMTMMKTALLTLERWWWREETKTEATLAHCSSNTPRLVTSRDVDDGDDVVVVVLYCLLFEAKGSNPLLTVDDDGDGHGKDEEEEDVMEEGFCNQLKTHVNVLL